MLDGWARKKIDPALIGIAEFLARSPITPNMVTIISCVVGIAAAGAIAFQHYWLGLFLILASRLGDGLDGALARLTTKTDFGGYLDIVLDFVFYGAIPMGFVLADPAQNAVAGAALILSFYINGASFLAYATMAEKRGLQTSARGTKALYFTTGLAEATETIAVFIAFCLFPSWFAFLAWIFAVICIYTATARILQAAAMFRD